MKLVKVIRALYPEGGYVGGDIKLIVGDLGLTVSRYFGTPPIRSDLRVDSGTLLNIVEIKGDSIITEIQGWSFSIKELEEVSRYSKFNALQIKGTAKGE